MEVEFAMEEEDKGGEFPTPSLLAVSEMVDRLLMTGAVMTCMFAMDGLHTFTHTYILYLYQLHMPSCDHTLIKTVLHGH